MHEGVVISIPCGLIRFQRFNLTGNQEARLETLKRLDLRAARVYQIELTPASFREVKNPLRAVAYLKSWFLG